MTVPKEATTPDMLRLAVAAVLEADREFRANMPPEWEGDPLSDEIDGLRRVFSSTLTIAGEGKELDGWQLVPVEPTVAMRMPWKTMRGDAWYDKYKAMLDAAPDAGKVNGEHLKALQSLKILPFSGNALIQIVEGVKGSMEHGTWRDDKGMRLKDTNEWMFFYTTFKAAAAKHPQDRQNPSALDALQAIADLPTGKSEDEMNGQESAYRAVEALFVSPPHIVAAVPTDDTSSDMTRRLAAHCQSLIDIIDDVQVRCDEPVDDEDMDMVRYIGDDAASALISSPGKDGGQEVEAVGEQWRAIEDGSPKTSWYPVGYGDEAGWRAIANRCPDKYQIETRPVYAQPASTAQEVEELRREIASLEYRLEEANGHLRRLEKSAEPTAWGEVRRGSDGNLAIFSTKFNTVKARFTSGNDLKPGEKVYVGTQPASTALVERLTSALLKAEEVLANYADPTGYTDGYGDPVPADAVQHEGLLAQEALDVVRSALSASSREGER